MRKFKHILAIVLCTVMPVALFSADSGYKVAYDGGSLPDIKSGTAMKLHIELNQIRLTRDKAEVVTIPAASVTEISYGQDVHRRVGAAIGIGLAARGVVSLFREPIT
jgi:hypothetical protein